MTRSRTTIVLLASLVGFGVFAIRGQEPAEAQTSVKQRSRIKALEESVVDLHDRVLELEKTLGMIRSNPKDRTILNILRANEEKRAFRGTQKQRIARRRKISLRQKKDRLHKILRAEPLDLEAWAKTHQKVSDLDFESLADAAGEHRAIADSNFAAIDQRLKALEDRE